MGKRTDTGLKCPYCGGLSTYVYGGGHYNRQEGAVHKRRRKCADCNAVFDTVERYYSFTFRGRDNAQK